MSLQTAKLCVGDGGRLVIQTPNMGSFLGWHMRYNDITHEFGVTEKGIVDLLLAAGFEKKKLVFTLHRMLLQPLDICARYT
jgi:hypothetical protein